jgi:hypothetical protein
MSGLSAYKSSPRAIRKFITRILAAGRVPFVKSSPGMGKSTIVKNIAKEFNMMVIDHRMSTSAPEDMSGLPTFITVTHPNGTETRVASFIPFDIFPTTNTPLVEGTEGWIVFLDEFNSAPKTVQAASYKLILDREVGQEKLHERVMVVCAGNLDTDRAIVNSMSTAMQSRVIHLEMEINFDEFMKDVALPFKWDNRIVAYLSYKPSMIMDFRPDHNEHTFCCPRTWEFMNDLIQGQEVLIEDAPLYAGTITSGVALDFIQFTKVYASLPKISVVLSDPENVQIPQDPPSRYAAIMYLTEHTNDKTLAGISVYINRFTAEFRILFFRTLMIQQPALREHPAFRSALLDLSRYLND